MSENTPIVENPDTRRGNGENKTDVATALRSTTFRWTARDQYASAAMQALISTMRADTIAHRTEQLAANAYRIADAMLKHA